MKLTGNQVIEKLLCLTDGESLVANGVEWTSLGESFAVAADRFGEPAEGGDATLFVRRGDLDEYFDGSTEYEAVC